MKIFDRKSNKKEIKGAVFSRRQILNSGGCLPGCHLTHLTSCMNSYLPV